MNLILTFTTHQQAEYGLGWLEGAGFKATRYTPAVGQADRGALVEGVFYADFCGPRNQCALLNPSTSREPGRTTVLHGVDSMACHHV